MTNTTENRRLLIVDDSKVSRMMIRAFFAKHCPAWTLHEAADGAEAMAQAAAHPPDCVTLDVNMPGGMDGFAVATELLRLRPGIRIVMLTANIQESSRGKAQDLKVGFVAKPATESALAQALAYLTAP